MTIEEDTQWYLLHGDGISEDDRRDYRRFSCQRDYWARLGLNAVVQENCDDRIRSCRIMDSGISVDRIRTKWIDFIVVDLFDKRQESLVTNIC